MTTVNYREAAKNMIRDGTVLQIRGVTVGKYQTAVRDPGKQFLVTGHGPDAFFYPAQDAIEEFVARVGAVGLMAATQEEIRS